MKKIALLYCFAIIIIFFHISALAINGPITITSPKGNIKVTVSIKDNRQTGQPYFSVEYINGSKVSEVLPLSPMGIKRKDQDFTDNLKIVSVSYPVQIKDPYKLLHGKRSNCYNEATETTIHFENTNNRKMDIIFRAYNNGMAFKYSFTDTIDSIFVVTDEVTAFHIPNGTKRWMQPYTGYEDFYPYNDNGTDEKNHASWSFPALYNVKDQPYWVLISEANLTKDNCATNLWNKADREMYKVNGQQVVFSNPWNSQWRVMVIGPLKDIVENTLITDVSQPNKIKDTKWVQPGPVSWIYWAYNHGSKDYKKVVEYIDLAVEMKWPYVLIDWEWEVMANGGTIEDAVAYAKNKGIKVLVWYNSGKTGIGGSSSKHKVLLTHESRVKEFEWLNKIGISGVKIDFFNGDKQETIRYYLELLEDVAQYKLLVNFHGATIPRGWERAYPNLMSTEAVYGAEWYNNKDVLTHEAGKHNTTLPFTRNAIGPMDYTPVTFSNSQHPHITSYGHELALSIIFESGLQHFADRPSAYESLPTEPKTFLQAIPTAWDDTKLIDGYPAEKVVMARRKENKWYVAGINGSDDAKTLTLTFGYLDNKEHTLHLITDGVDNQHFGSKTLKVNKKSKVEVNTLSLGGFVGTIDNH